MERVQIDGSVRRKNIVIGTLEEFPNESAAQAAVYALQAKISILVVFPQGWKGAYWS